MTVPGSVKQVALPAGFDKLLTNRSPTGSLTERNMIGILRVSWRSARTTTVVAAMITSGASPANSAA